MKMKVIRKNQDLGGNCKCVEYLEEVSLLIERNNKMYFIKYSVLSAWYPDSKTRDYFSIDSIIIFRK